MNSPTSPETAHALLLLAQLYVEADLPEEAQACLIECLSIQHAVFPTQENEGVASGASNVPDDAPAHMPSVLVLHPSVAECASLMGTISKTHMK